MAGTEIGFPRGKRLRTPKGVLLLLMGVLGVILLAVGNLGGNRTEASPEEGEAECGENAEENMERYALALEAKIKALCESVNGVSSVRVAVTLASGYEYVYAKDAEAESGSDGTVGSYRYVTIGSGSNEQVVFLSEKPPRIGGIGVVCRGGGSAGTRRELIELISAAFGVPSNKIYITEGSGAP